MLIPVRQKFVRRGLRDVAAEARRVLAESGLASRLKPGSRVAIGAGSRGVSNIATLMKAVVDYFSSEGHTPFIFPAMGSHGAATAQGQASVLAHYGIDEAAMGCPIKSAFEVVSLGRTKEGIEAFAGRDAWESDAIFAVNRIKWHTSFAGSIESGVAKMIAIGLGKQEGAKSVHGYARRIGMDPAIRSVARRILASGKVLGGLGVLEDAFHQTAQIAALPAESLISDEEELLKTVKSWMARIPVEALDVLIVDEIGKNISGTGMDLKIVNRGVAGQVNPWPDAPRIERIFVRDLSPLSYGNAVGIGAADVLHDRVVQKIDVKAGRINALTSGSLGLVKIPLHFASDRECFELAAATVGRFNPEELTVARIRNTLELEKIAISENLLPEIRKNGDVEVAGDPFELRYDSAGNLEAHD